ncbi:MAG: class I SAM-dependent methyltransferase [Bacteroidetes bacterium]|nr:class I SAM-dependent methyltransferase [Bacteroidota bacterium]
MKNRKPDYIGTDYGFDSVLSSSAIDELPLWSAPFGLALLDAVEYRKKITALDIGFGTGFPLIELAQRLGKSSTVYGIDPWRPSHLRAKYRMKFHGIDNVILIKGAAEEIPLKDKSVDLIVSNNGTNNVQDIDKVFAECSRIAKRGAQFIITVNLDATFKEFYTAFFKVLEKRGMNDEIIKLKKHIRDKRPPLEETKSLFEKNGFRIRKVVKDKFVMKFADAESFFSHSLIKLGFSGNWEKLLPQKSAAAIFRQIGKSLSQTAKERKFTVPFALIDTFKV